MTPYKIISGLVAAAFLISTSNNVQAQSRPSDVASLGEMRCQSLTNAVGYRAINRDIPIGREILRAIAYFDGIPAGFLRARRGPVEGRPASIACRLAAPNQAPLFRTLTLSFGFADNSAKIDYLEPLAATELRLSVYRDSKLYESRTVRPGERIRWPINISGTRSISLEADCIRGAQAVPPANDKQTCPVLYFFEDILE